MVEHRFLKRLMCHQCGESKPVPKTCPSCAAEDRLAVVGPGVERLAEEATALFPEAKVAVLSSDLFGSARALKEQIAKLAAGEVDVIIGTQLVAKGHNFPKLTLVGVIDADLGLQGSDLRAAERTFQLMRQVAGRAGRSDKPGVAALQTHQPEHHTKWRWCGTVRTTASLCVRSRTLTRWACIQVIPSRLRQHKP